MEYRIEHDTMGEVRVPVSYTHLDVYKRQDMHIDSAGFSHIIDAPDFVKELVARERDARMGQKQFQKFKFLERQCHTLAIGSDCIFIQIDDQTACLEQMLHPVSYTHLNP